MINVTFVTSDMGSEYSWGIKNYTLHLAKNFGNNVKIVIEEKKYKGIQNYIIYPKSVKSHLNQQDILHLISQTFGYFTRFKFQNPTVITCHDMMAFSRPDMFDSKKRAILSRLLIRGMDKCDKIISVSEFTKNEVMRYMKIDEDKISAVHSGISEDFRPHKKKSDLDYIVYFGSEEKRKNISALIDAFSLLKMSFPELKLVKNYDNPKIREKIRSMGLEKDVIITGNLSEKMMAEYYSNAKAFVFPSLFEGFGFTPLEAMACGCPVASSNAAAMPEILGDAPLYFNPSNPEEIAQSVSSIMNDKTLSIRLSRKSTNRAKKFTWKTTAKKTRKVYEEVLE